MSQLHLGVNDVPSWHATLLYGFQQAMVCVPGLIITPQIAADVMCAGSATAALKAQLISAVFVAAGIGTFLQSTFGLRLAMMHGPAAAFLPPLLAYQASINCKAGPTDYVDEEEWQERLREVACSLLVACLAFLFIGGSGLAGLLARRIGPITIIPVMLLLIFSLLPLMQQMMSSHWISILTLLIVATMIIYLEKVPIPLPKGRKFYLFGQYPLILTFSFTWFLCYILTVTNVEPENSVIRTDRPQNTTTHGWIKFPVPIDLWPIKINIGLVVAYTSAVLVDMVENLGSYDLISKVSEQKRAPKDAINRALIVEGFASMLAASMGVGVGLTTYSGNVAIIQVTKVASRRTMQAAGLMLVIFGIFPKSGAFLASIPEPIVGGVVVTILATVIGVTLSNLQTVDLKISRNMSIIGLALVLGIMVPLHIEKHPINTGHKGVDEVVNMLLGIQMLVGGIIAVFLDNTVTGASMLQRGLKADPNENDGTLSEDGYAFPRYMTRVWSKIPGVRSLPFLPKVYPEDDKIPQTSPWSHKIQV